MQCTGGRRFVVALLTAAGVHALALAWQFGRRVSTKSDAESMSRVELQIELDRTQSAEPTHPSEDLAENAASESVSIGAPTAPAPGGATPGHPSASTRVVTAGPQPTAATNLDSGELGSVASAAVASATEATTNEAPPSTPSSAIDLGLDGKFLRPTFRDAQAQRRAPRDLGVELQRKLDESFRGAAVEEDVQRGRGRGNVLLGALSSAVRTSGPPFGEAIISAAFNSSGELNGLTLIRGTAGDWSKAIQAFREQAKRKKVPVPAGAKGLRVTFRVATKIQHPSGKEIGHPPVSIDPPSLAASGLTLKGAFDVADLSGKSSQSVSARVISEEVVD